LSRQATVLPHDEAPSTSLLSAWIETTKPRITRLVTITSAVGFLMSLLARSARAGIEDWRLVGMAAAGCLVGTALSAGGANSLNQWIERHRDARMPRTAERPIPRGRISPHAVLFGGAAACVAGVLTLWAASGPVPALVALATITMYLGLYTPLKPWTPLATIVGAVPGALPPVIGWTAAALGEGSASLAEPAAWALFLIMFVWQVPHFLAIAWLYREDYALGGYRVLPVDDPRGVRTAAAILAWTILLVPVTAAPVVLMPANAGPGQGYVTVAIATSLGFLWLALRLARSRTRNDAKATFIASIIHLPVLLVVLVADSAAAVIW
jgi:protoheme IX farnesyltransferase